MTITIFLWCLGMCLSGSLGAYGIDRHEKGGTSIYVALGMFGILMAAVCFITVCYMIIPLH